MDLGRPIKEIDIIPSEEPVPQETPVEVPDEVEVPA